MTCAWPPWRRSRSARRPASRCTRTESVGGGQGRPRPANGPPPGGRGDRPAGRAGFRRAVHRRHVSGGHAGTPRHCAWRSAWTAASRGAGTAPNRRRPGRPARLDLAVSLPAVRRDLEVEVLYGGTLLDRGMEASDRLGFALELPHRWPEASRAIAVRFLFRPRVSAAVHGVVPRHPCDLFDLRVRFGQERPREVWALDGAFQRDVSDPAYRGRRHRSTSRGAAPAVPPPHAGPGVRRAVGRGVGRLQDRVDPRVGSGSWSRPGFPVRGQDFTYWSMNRPAPRPAPVASLPGAMVTLSPRGGTPATGGSLSAW